MCTTDECPLCARLRDRDRTARFDRGCGKTHLQRTVGWLQMQSAELPANPLGLSRAPTGRSGLTQQSGLLPHDREDSARLPPVALYHTFEFRAAVCGHAETVDDNVADPVHMVVSGQAPIDSDRR